MDVDEVSIPDKRLDRVGKGGRGRATLLLAAAGTTLYVFVFFVQVPQWVGDAFREYWLFPRNALQRFILSVYELLGFSSSSWQFRAGGFFLLTSFLLPWAVMPLLGRYRPADLGWRVPNRLTWPIVIIALLLSTPFTVWMVRSPGFLPYYESHLRGGIVTFCAYYTVVMFCEHFLFHGAMLAVLRRGRRWPPPERQENRSARALPRRLLQWIGLAQPTAGATGGRRIIRWLGLSDGCLPAIVVSALLFGAMHWGKDGREFVLSFPGGVFLAYSAYRCNSWFAPFILHALTAGTACLMMILAAR